MPFEFYLIMLVLLAFSVAFGVYVYRKIRTKLDSMDLVNLGKGLGSNPPDWQDLGRKIQTKIESKANLDASLENDAPDWRNWEDHNSEKPLDLRSTESPPLAESVLEERPVQQTRVEPVSASGIFRLRLWTIAFLCLNTALIIDLWALEGRYSNEILSAAVILEPGEDMFLYSAPIIAHLLVIQVFFFAGLVGWLFEMIGRPMQSATEEYSRGGFLSLFVWPVSFCIDHVVFGEMTVVKFLAVVFWIGFFLALWGIYKKLNEDGSLTKAANRGKAFGEAIGGGPRENVTTGSRFKNRATSTSNSFTKPSSPPKIKEKKMPANKTVYVVYQKMGGAMVKYSEAKTLSMAEHIANTQRKRGKEMRIVLERR